MKKKGAVVPLNKEQIKSISAYFKDTLQNEILHDLFNIGLNLALRIGDLVKLKYSDVDFDNNYITIIEQKTKQHHKLFLNNKVLSIILKRYKKYQNDIYIFKSHNTKYFGDTKEHITAKYVTNRFVKIGELYNIRLGTHSMRKTYGAFLYDNGVGIGEIAKVLNHKNTSSTLHYIGVDQRKANKIREEFIL